MAYSRIHSTQTEGTGQFSSHISFIQDHYEIENTLCIELHCKEATILQCVRVNRRDFSIRSYRCGVGIINFSRFVSSVVYTSSYCTPQYYTSIISDVALDNRNVCKRNNHRLHMVWPRVWRLDNTFLVNNNRDIRFDTRFDKHWYLNSYTRREKSSMKITMLVGKNYCDTCTVKKCTSYLFEIIFMNLNIY